MTSRIAVVGATGTLGSFIVGLVERTDGLELHAGLTIIRVRSAKPPELVTHNDLGHLPVELRTGLPVEQPI